MGTLRFREFPRLLQNSEMVHPLGRHYDEDHTNREGGTDGERGDGKNEHNPDLSGS
jgi:hypothetical protein